MKDEEILLLLQEFKGQLEKIESVVDAALPLVVGGIEIAKKFFPICNDLLEEIEMAQANRLYSVFDQFIQNGATREEAMSLTEKYIVRFPKSDKMAERFEKILAGLMDPMKKEEKKRNTLPDLAELMKKAQEKGSSSNRGTFGRPGGN